jgi:hypothetical protein
MATSQMCCHLPGKMLNLAAECADRARIATLACLQKSRGQILQLSLAYRKEEAKYCNSCLSTEKKRSNIATLARLQKRRGQILQLSLAYRKEEAEYCNSRLPTEKKRSNIATLAHLQKRRGGKLHFLAVDIYLLMCETFPWAISTPLHRVLGHY